MEAKLSEIKKLLVPFATVALLAGTTACSHSKASARTSAESATLAQQSSGPSQSRVARRDNYSILFAKHYQTRGVYNDPVAGPENLTAFSRNVPGKPTDVALTNIHCNDDSGISGTVKGYIIGKEYVGNFDISGDEVLATGECAHGGTKLDTYTNAGLIAEFLLGAITEQTELVVPSGGSPTSIG